MKTMPLNRIEKIIASILGVVSLGFCVAIFYLILSFPADGVHKLHEGSQIKGITIGINLGMALNLGVLSLAMLKWPSIRLAFLLLWGSGMIWGGVNYWICSHTGLPGNSLSLRIIGTLLDVVILLVFSCRPLAQSIRDKKVHPSPLANSESTALPE